MIKTRKTIWLLIIFIGGWFLSQFAYAHTKFAELVDSRIAQRGDMTRIVLVANQSVLFHVFTLHHPERVVVDIQKALLATVLNQTIPSNSIVTDIRYATKANGLRLVFDLKAPAKFSAQQIPPSSHPQARLIFDLQSQEKSSVTTTKEQITPRTSQTSNTRLASKTQRDDLPDAQPAQPASTAVLPTHVASIDADQLPDNNVPTTANADHPVTVTKVLSARRGNIIITIDPGHGGKDPGATGPRGTHEKNVVIAIAKDLQHDLNQQKGFTAKLTRKGNYFLTLRQRLDVARKDNADLFVAIHADAYMDTTAEGASVYALSQTGATNEAARWLADRDNYSELGGVSNFADKSYLVRSVLLDLSQTVTISQSLQLGYVLLHSLKAVTALHHNIVEQARFVVLKSPDIPSLLVETGFITNADEENRLNSSSYQQKVAEALSEGIISYFHAHPPQAVEPSKMRPLMMQQGIAKNRSETPS